MPAKVTLQVLKGGLDRKRYEFHERTTCVIGRARDCNIRIPDDRSNRAVSRYHCLLDISPPRISVRDFGSKNGTRINGEKIGQRALGVTAKEGREIDFPMRELENGDLVQIGGTVFRVKAGAPPRCLMCAAEILSGEKREARVRKGLYLCPACRRKEKTGLNDTARTRPAACVKCGKEIAAGQAAIGHGDMICGDCRTDTSALNRFIVTRARRNSSFKSSLKDYEILEELGAGGMGAVSLARRGDGRLVALKTLAPHAAADPQMQKMFLREVENTRALDHPNIVRLFDYGYAGGMFFFTMEYCDGGNAATLMIERGGTLDVAEAAGVILQVLDGLEYAHNVEIPSVKLADGTFGAGKGLVHRDLKPHNILLQGSGAGQVVKIADFGLAKAFDMAGLSGHTAGGVVSGSPGFTSRVQALNYRFAKPAVDVWAAAASFYFMLTGVHPREFDGGKNPWKVITEKKPTPIRERDDTIPARLAEVIDRALIDDPAIPYQTAAKFKRALEQAL